MWSHNYKALKDTLHPKLEECEAQIAENYEREYTDKNDQKEAPSKSEKWEWLKHV